MTALPDLTARLRVDTSDLSAAVGRASKSGSAIGSALGSAVGNLAGGALASAGSGLLGFAQNGIDAFSRVEDATAAAGVTFGKAQADVVAFSKTAAASFGISEGAALDAALTFGTMGKSAGLSGADLSGFANQFTALAGDMASFRGTSPEQAVEAIGAALRGETEPIRAYGVLLDDATLRQEALALGLIKTTKDALSPQNKALAAASAITKQTKDAVGDFSETSTSTANTQKRLAAETENAAARLGKQLAPAMTAAREGVLALIKGLSGFVDVVGPPVATAVTAFQAFFAALREGDVTSDGLVGRFEMVGDALHRFGGVLGPAVAQLVAFVRAIPQGVLQALAAVLGVVAAAIVVQTAATTAARIATGLWRAVTAPFVVTKSAEGAVIARGTVARLAHNLATIASTAATVAWAAATKTATVVMKALNIVLRMNPIGLVVTAITLLVGSLVLAYKRSETFRAIVDRAFATVKAGATSLAALVQRLLPGAFGAAVAAVRGYLSGLVNLVRGVVKIVVGVFTGDFGKVKEGASQAIRGVIAVVTTLPRLILGALRGLGGLLVNSGRELMAGLARGIQEKIDDVVQKVRDAAQRIKDLLPGSPVKDGPLRSWNNGGAGVRLMQTLVDGIHAGTPNVRDALAGALDTLPDPAQLTGAARATLHSTTSRATAAPAPQPAPAAALPRSLTLRVGDRAFTAYLEDVASAAADRMVGRDAYLLGRTGG